MSRIIRREEALFTITFPYVSGTKVGEFDTKAKGFRADAVVMTFRPTTTISGGTGTTMTFVPRFKPSLTSTDSTAGFFTKIGEGGAGLDGSEPILLNDHTTFILKPTDGEPWGLPAIEFSFTHDGFDTGVVEIDVEWLSLA